MPTKGQYKYFAMISYSAIQMQLSIVNAQAGAGLDSTSCNEILYIAKNLTGVVAAYGCDCLNVDGHTENDIIRICNWLTANLKFTTNPIGTLGNEFLSDFERPDFNSNDFA